MGGLGEDAVDRVAERQLQAEGHAARRAADAAGQIDEQRMLRIHDDPRRRQLLLQPLRRDGVAEKQVGRVLVVDKMAGGIGFGLFSTLGDGHAVVGGVFDDRHAVRAQPVLLPLAGVGGHVHRHLEAQGRAHDADGQAEVAGGPDGDLVAAEEGPRLVAV
ncbi:hypothetical protein D3C87_1240170 [compost metagenome]